VSVSLTNSDPSIGTVVSPVTITGGNHTATSAFHPLQVGSTSIAVNAPPGFANPASLASMLVKVNP